jgi:CheY-like chemotaxis protein
LFEPFSQGPRTLDRQQGGLGLGLALARRLIELHGGSVKLDPSHRPGARFVIRLAADAGMVVEPSAEQIILPRATASKHVLLVDDNTDAAEMLRLGLEGAGYTVSVGSDAASAETASSQRRPDVGVLDIGLPEVDGYELARRLRSRYPGIRLVALTGYGQPADADAAARAGFDAHCTKPIALAALFDCIEGPGSTA